MAVADPFGLIGQIIDGQLRVDQVIGEGGFSIVYKGEHLGLGEPIAIKCLKLPRKLDPKLAEAFGKRFKDEGRLLYRLSQGSLYIVRSITSGTCIATSTGMLVPYMALEWLDGHSLVQEFRERRARGKMPLSLEEAVKLFDPAVQALAYAHSQGVVHRDIKPGNLIYANTREGPKLKVLDFGLAKIFDDEAIGMQPSVKTAGNFFMCSPSYGAPEQFDPRTGAVGPWTDVYAIALVFVESLADQKARHADSMAEGAILALNPKTKPTPRNLGVTVPDAVEEVIARAVALKPEQRPQSCGEFWGALKTAVRGAQPAAQDFARTVMEDPAIVEARVKLAEAMTRDKQPEPPPKTQRMSVDAPGAPLGPPPNTQRIAGLAATLPLDPSRVAEWQAARAQAIRPPTPVPPAPPQQQMHVATPVPPPPFPQQQGPYMPPQVRDQVPSFSEPSRVEGLPRSRGPMIFFVTLLILVLMGAAAWGGYVFVKKRAPPPTRVGQSESACPSSPT